LEFIIRRASERRRQGRGGMALTSSRGDPESPAKYEEFDLNSDD